MSDAGVGFLCAAIAVAFFGSNFVPVKKYEAGDGLFFQWIMCTAIWISGFIVNAAQGFPPFQPLAMLGGFLWCTGNIMVVPIVKMIGLSLGLLIWGTSNLIMGWSSGTFGLFGLTQEKVPIPWLNYLGFVVAMISIIIYVFVKSEATPVKSANRNNIDEQKSLINNDLTVDDSTWVDMLTPIQKRVLGIVLSLVSGILWC